MHTSDVDGHMQANDLERTLQGARKDAQTVADQLEFAKLKLVSATQKRRALALAVHTGVGAAQKALKTARQELSEAEDLCADLENALASANEKVSAIESEIETLRRDQMFSETMTAGMRQAETLSKIVDAAAKLLALCHRYMEECGAASFAPGRGASSPC